MGMDGEEGREWILPIPLYEDDLILCDESEEDLRAMVGRFVEVCRKIDVKTNPGMRKVMVLGGGEGGWRVRIRLEHVSEFKYLGCVLEKSGTDEAECRKKVESGRRVAGAIRYLVNARGLQLEYAGVLDE